MPTPEQMRNMPNTFHMKKPSKSLLNQLINQGKTHAEINLRRDGNVPPVLFGHTTDGEFMLMPPKFDDVPNKNQFAFIARLHCLAHKTKGVAFVSEVWVAPESPDELPDTPPCESLLRREYVMVSVETADGSAQQILLPIIRSDAGNFFGLGEPEMLSAKASNGRFARFMPAKKPTATDRVVARLILQSLQKQPAKPRNQRTRRR
jgi:hypothetical protein